MTKTKVIGFRVPNRNLLEWSIYCDQNNLEISDFLRNCIDGHINDNMPEDRPVFGMKKDNHIKYLHLEQIIDKSTYLNLRVDTEKIKYWDNYCTRNQLDRSKLLIDSVSRWLHPGTKAPIREYDRFKRIVQQVIRFFGIIDYKLLATIFDTIDESELIRILDELENEEEHSIWRKADGYIATHEPEQMVNIRQIVYNFIAFLQLIQKSENRLISDIDAANSDLSANKSLIIVIIEYLRVYISQYLQIHIQTELSGQKKLSKSEKEILEGFQKQITPDQIQISLNGSFRKGLYYVEIRNNWDGIKNVKEFVERKQIADKNSSKPSEGHLLFVDSEIPEKDYALVEKTLEEQKSKWKFL